MCCVEMPAASLAWVRWLAETKCYARCHEGAAVAASAVDVVTGGTKLAAGVTGDQPFAEVQG